MGPDDLKLLHDVERASRTLQQLDSALKAHAGSDNDNINESDVSDIKTDLDVITHDLSSAYAAVSSGEIRLQLDVDGSAPPSSQAVSTSSNTADSALDRNSSCTSSAWSPTRSDGPNERTRSKDALQNTDDKALHDSGQPYVHSVSPNASAAIVRRASVDWRSPFASPDPLSLSFEEASALIMTPDDEMLMSAVRSRSGTGSTALPEPKPEPIGARKGPSTPLEDIYLDSSGRHIDPRASPSKDSLRSSDGSSSPSKTIQPAIVESAPRKSSETTHLSPTSAATDFGRRSRTSSLSSIREAVEEQRRPAKRQHIADFAVANGSARIRARSLERAITVFESSTSRTTEQDGDSVDRLRNSLSSVFGGLDDDDLVKIAVQSPSTPPPKAVPTAESQRDAVEPSFEDDAIQIPLPCTPTQESEPSSSPPREREPPSTPPREREPTFNSPRSPAASPTMPARRPPPPPAPRRSRTNVRKSSYRIVNASPPEDDSSEDELYTVSRPSSPKKTAAMQVVSFGIPQVNVADHDDETGGAVVAQIVQDLQDALDLTHDQNLASQTKPLESSANTVFYNTANNKAILDTQTIPRKVGAAVSASPDRIEPSPDVEESPPPLPKRPQKRSPPSPQKPLPPIVTSSNTSVSRHRSTIYTEEVTTPQTGLKSRSAFETEKFRRGDQGLGIQMPVRSPKERASVDATMNGLRPSHWAQTMGSYKDKWRQGRASSTTEIHMVPQSPIEDNRKAPEIPASVGSPGKPFSFDTTMDSGSFSPEKKASSPSTGEKPQKHATPNSPPPTTPALRGASNSAVAEWYAPEKSENTDLLGLDLERQNHIIHFFNASVWHQAEAYLVDYLSSLLERNDLARARRVRHLLGVCASFQGELERAISLFQSVIRSPVDDVSAIDDGDCAAAYWLGDAYAQLNKRTEALLAYSVAERSSLFKDGDLAGLSTLVRLEQEAVQLGASRADFKLRYAQEALKQRSPSDPVSILDTAAISMPAARILLDSEPRKDLRPKLLELNANHFRSSTLLKLNKSIHGVEYHRTKINAQAFVPDTTWPMMYDPFFSIANVRKGRLLAQEYNLADLFSRSEGAKVARSVGLSNFDSFTSDDLLWLIRTIRECLKMFGMGFSEVATTQSTCFMVRYSFMLNGIATTYYFAINLFRQTLRPGYGVDICPDGVCSARIIRTNLDFDKGVNHTEAKRIKKLIREYLDGAAKDKRASYMGGSRTTELMPPPIPPRPQGRATQAGAVS